MNPKLLIEAIFTEETAPLNDVCMTVERWTEWAINDGGWSVYDEKVRKRGQYKTQQRKNKNKQRRGGKNDNKTDQHEMRHYSSI